MEKHTKCVWSLPALGGGGRAEARVGFMNGWRVAGGMKGSWALQGSLSPVIPLREHRLALSNAVNAHFTQFAGFPVVYDRSVVLHPATFSWPEAGILVRIKYRHVIKFEFRINGKSFLVCVPGQAICVLTIGSAGAPEGPTPPCAFSVLKVF